MLLLDLPRFAWALRPDWLLAGRRPPWIYVRNRHERLIEAPGARGVACTWRWTSALHAPRVLPALGRRLLRAALRECPIRLAAVDEAPAAARAPDVTFLIGHRGEERVPHLLLTLRSIAAQAGTSVECIVVEQDRDQAVRARLPAWVRYLHTPPPAPAMAYCRSWAFNVGARHARGRLLVLHDNDMLVPEVYAAELGDKHRKGYEVINLKRFVFYLSPRHTEKLLGGRASLNARAPETIVQNLEAGGSLGVDREAYFALGGLDEEFVGWGGEDNEFWERALTRRVYPFGYLPVVHLWHPPQPGKRAVRRQGATTAELAVRRAAVPPELRMRELHARNFGNPRRPDPGPPVPAEARGGA